MQERAGLRFGGAVIICLAREVPVAGPQRLAVLAPEQVQRPPWQLLAGIPLSLSEMPQPLRRIVFLEPRQQFTRQHPLALTQRLGVPLDAVAIIDRHESGFPALRQAHIADGQLAVDLVSQRLDLLPLLVAVGQRYARGFPFAPHAHRMLELHLAFGKTTADGSGRTRLRRAGQRNVALAGQQA